MFTAAEIRRGKILAQKFREIVNTPVKSVKPKMNVASMRGGVPEVAHRITHPLVSNVGRTPRIPAAQIDVVARKGICRARTQHDLFEVRYGGVGEKRKVQSGWAVIFPEIQMKGMFARKTVTTAGVPVNAETGLRLKAPCAIR